VSSKNKLGKCARAGCYTRVLSGLQMAKDLGYSTIIAEEDSQILLSALGKLINKSPPNRVSKNWCLSTGLAEVVHAIWGTSTIILSNVRCQANLVVDYLANVVVGHPQGESQWLLKDVEEGDFINNLTHLNQNDNPPLHSRTGGEPSVHLVGLSEAQMSLWGKRIP